MRIKLQNITLIATILVELLIANSAWAAPIIGQGTWETTLQARDLDGDLTTTEAFYDTTLNITWLADAALSKTETFIATGGTITSVSTTETTA